MLWLEDDRIDEPPTLSCKGCSAKSEHRIVHMLPGANGILVVMLAAHAGGFISAAQINRLIGERI